MKYPYTFLPELESNLAAFTETELLSFKHRLWFNHQLLNYFLDNSLGSLMVTNADNKVVCVNRTFTEVSGYSEAEVLGKTPRLVQSTQHSADFYQTMWQCIIDTGSWAGQVWNRRKNGEVYLQQLVINTLTNEQNTVTHYVAMGRDLTIDEPSDVNKNFFTLTDPLTNLGNRQLLTSRLKQAIAEGQRNKIRVGLLIIDGGQLRAINENLGLAIGDELLRQQANILHNTVDKADTLVRLQGDVFAVLRHSQAEDVLMAQLAHQILSLLSQPLTLGDNIVESLQPSIGIAIYPRDGTNSANLLQAAEDAHHMAKRKGRSCYQFFDLQQHELHYRELLIEHSLQKILTSDNADGLTLYYQPQVCYQTGQVLALEALLRWQHTRLGSLSPNEFIPIAEQTGLSVALDRWVIKQVFKQVARWQLVFAKLPVLSINLSAHQLIESDFADWIKESLNDANICASQIKLEVTESTMMQANCASMLDELRCMGFKISLDDFGTGYSALASLHKFSFDELKIDRSFMIEASNNKRALLLLKTVGQLAHQLSLSLVIEGVETKEQLDLLADLCPLTVQGYYFYRPLPVAEINQLLESKVY